MSIATINLWRWRERVSRMIVFGALGLITSGCPMMMVPMMGGMSGSQHQEQKKESPANTVDGATAPQSHNTGAGH
ncbi:MAG: hypothetical protein HQL90_05150 [Magnetococcales bacterium]|nr:hypothetical protein [Magnetococcales bacterium]